MGRQQEVVEPDHGQVRGHGPAEAVRGVEHADGHQVGGGDDRGRRLRQVEHGAQPVLAAGEAVRNPLHVAGRRSPEVAGQVLDVGILAMRVVAGEASADEPDAPVPEPDEVVEGGMDPAPVVDVDRRELDGARSLPEGNHRNGRVAQVLEQPGLVLHVPEHDDGIAVPDLEDRAQGDLGVEPAMGVPQHDVVALVGGRRRERLEGRREERVAEVADDRADQHRRRSAQGARHRVRPVPELLRGRDHPGAGLLRDRNPGRGVVQDARDRAVRDAGDERDVAHPRDGAGLARANHRAGAAGVPGIVAAASERPRRRSVPAAVRIHQ